MKRKNGLLKRKIRTISIHLGGAWLAAAGAGGWGLTGCAKGQAPNGGGSARLAGEESEAKVQVKKNEADIARRVFDPAHPPEEMPKLSTGEAALTESKYGCEARVGVLVMKTQKEGDQIRATVRVTSITVTLKLGVTIWLPKGANEKLRSHEEGHRLIAEIEYEPVERIADDLADAEIGRTYEGRGATAEEASREAITSIAHRVCQSYLGAVAEPAQRIQDTYDALTDHGRNKLVESEAVRMALAKQAHDVRQGNAGTNGAHIIERDPGE